MNDPDCRDFTESIQKHFSYLFEDYGFHVMASQGIGHGEACVVILQSPQCRMKFYRAQGEANCLLGTLQAPVSLQLGGGEGKQWHYIRDALDYVENKLPDLEEIEREIRRRLSFDDQLIELAARLRPVCSQVVRLFETEVFRQQEQAYEAFQQRSLDSLKQQRNWRWT